MNMAKRGHVESYFFRLNSPDSKRALWLKATAFVPRGKPEGSTAEAWVIAFTRGGKPTALKSSIPLKEAVFPREGEDELNIDTNDFTVSNNRLSGKWENGKHEISCDLKMQVHENPMELFFHKKLYTMRFPKTKLVTPAPVATFDGEYVVDGERVEVKGWKGMGGHNWGSEHTPVYVWCQINSWDGNEDIVFEGVTARARMGRRLTPSMTIVTIKAEGETFSFNGPIRMFLNRGLIGPMKWNFSAGDDIEGVSGEVVASPAESAGLYYRNPDGSVIHCLNSKLASAKLALKRPGKPETILTSNQAALELGSPDKCYGVEMLV